MNNEKRDLIKKLAKEATEAETKVQMLEMQNIAGISHHERIQINQEYALSKAELAEANAKLDRVINGYSENRLPSDVEMAMYLHQPDRDNW